MLSLKKMRHVPIFVCAFMMGVPALAGEVNIYSYRQPELLAPIVEGFEKQTGHKVNVLFAKDGLVERAQLEGENSQADLILTTGVQPLVQASELGLFATLGTLPDNLASEVVSPDNDWVGLSLRPRIFYVSKDKADVKIQTYDDVLQASLKQRFCSRPLKHVYNLSWLGGMIERRGVSETKSFLTSLQAQMARTPQGNDRAQVQAIHEGICDASIGNAYYYGKMLANDEQKPWADSVNLVFATDREGGVHVDISGAGILTNAPNKEIAQEFINYALSSEAQAIYADVNSEFPVVDGVAKPVIFDAVGAWSVSRTPLVKIAANAKQAAMLVDEVGIDVK
mgnify:FL=1